MDIKINVVDDGFMLLSWKDEIDDFINDQVINKSLQIRGLCLSGVIDIVPAYSSLAIYYDPLQLKTEDLVTLVNNFPSTKNHAAEKTKIIDVPVCYEIEYGIDIEELCQYHNISPGRLVEIHTAAEYKVYFIGFLPGFMYLGGMDEHIWTPRRIKPRARIAAGSVGIGGNQTGVYPLNSPGGWNIIGRCPLVLFDADKEKPCRFSAGDLIRFKSIEKSEYLELYKSEHL